MSMILCETTEIIEMGEEPNEEIGEYGESLPEEIYGPSLSSLFFHKKICAAKWRQAPRNPSFFSDCKTSISSLKESDYEDWLVRYYDELRKQEDQGNFANKITDTEDLEDGEIPMKKSPALSVFASTAAKESTKYWGIKETRRHWPLTKTSKEFLLFPTVHPLLNVSSRYGRYCCILHSASGRTEMEQRKRLCAIFKLNLLRAKVFSYQLAKLILCDNMSLSWFDVVSKKVVLTTLCQLLRNQRHLEVACFENAKLQQLEGIVLLCALSKNGGDVVKELHMWNMFAYGQCPVLKDTNSLAARSKSNQFQNIDLMYHFMEILNNFSSLTHLSMNYAYLANRDGDALLRFKTIRCSCLMELRLLCLPEERPLRTNPNYGVGGYRITDGVWKLARQWNPKMRVMFVFVNMPQYENIILFLTKSIPLSSFYVSSGIDLTFETPWEIDTTLLELRNWYSSTLETLCLHLWHHRDLLDYVIQYKILEEFPNLQTFEFIGILRCLTTLEGFCRRLLTKQYKLKNLLLWVEETYSDKKKRYQTVKKVEEIKRIYLQKLQNIDIDAQLSVFPA